MGSSHPPGPALVADAANADPVTLLALAWLSARRSENTRTAYARDIGITPQRRPGRAPSWLAWCGQQGVHPVTGVTGLHVARYARQLADAGLSAASAARKLAAVSSWYAWLARRGHISASPAAGIARPRATPAAPPAPGLTQAQALKLLYAADQAPGPHRARTAALVALLLFTGARLSEIIGADISDLGTYQGHPVRWVTRGRSRRACRCPARPLPGLTPTSPDAPARTTSPCCSPPEPADGYSPPTCGAPCVASPPGPACQPTWPATSGPARYSTHSPRCTCRQEAHPATCTTPWDTPTRAPPGSTSRPRPPGSTGRLRPGQPAKPRTRRRGPGADLTAAPAGLS